MRTSLSAVEREVATLSTAMINAKRIMDYSSAVCSTLSDECTTEEYNLNRLSVSFREKLQQVIKSKV